jgi:coenzyme F420 hydrogenase subunit delta
LIENNDCIPEYCSKPTLILGCGNRLLGDDGFGPEVIEHLQARRPVPEDVALVDAGTGVVDILFDITLSAIKPRRIILIDTMGRSLPPGSISTLPLDSIQGQPLRTYSQHHIPTSRLLKELQELAGVEISLLTVEPEYIPEEIQPGLAPKVREAVLRAGDEIINRYYDSAPRTSTAS